jgi:hypothetical protein
VYETYINSLAPGERPIPLNVAQESHALRSITMVTIGRRWKVSLTWGPRLLPCRKRFAMTSAWRTTRPSSSICSQPTARSTSHLA